MTTPFLDSYGGQTTDQLIALEGTYRIDSLVLAFEQALQQKPELSKEESYILAVEGLERQVNNGGYSQFFANSSGEFSPIIERALRAIGCPKTADITRDAIKALRTDDLSAAAVAEAASPENEGLEACSDRYFSNDEPIADRLFEWIKANKAQIVLG